MMSSKNHKIRMTNDERSPNAQMTQTHGERLHDDSSFVIRSSFDIRHSSSPAGLIANAAKLASLIQEIESAERVAQRASQGHRPRQQ